LGYGPSSHDLRDCAELKVPVFDERTARGERLGPSHRVTYREFEPLPKVEDGRVVSDPSALPFRHVVAFEHRASDPAARTGERLARSRGLPVRDLAGLGGGRPSVGPQRPGVRTTPNRIPVPRDLLDAARQLSGTAPAADAVRAPNAAGDAAARRTQGPARGPQRDR
jgi:hypothetical protein